MRAPDFRKCFKSGGQAAGIVAAPQRAVPRGQELLVTYYEMA
jgi:hypothetical protein